MKKNVSLNVREMVEQAVNELGYSIWDVTYQKIGADYHLEITIDSPHGIGIEDTVRVSEVINPILDENDPIPGFYYLEVSSPGTDRELRTDEHITASLGKTVEAKLFVAKDGVKSITGTLKSFENDTLVIEAQDLSLSLARREISKMNLVSSDS